MADDIILTPAEEAYWEWTQKSVPPNGNPFFHLLGPLFAPTRFALGQRNIGFLVIVVSLGSLILAVNVSEAFYIPLTLFFIYEWWTTKTRIRKYNRKLRRQLEEKWNAKLPLSREVQRAYGLEWE